MVNSTLRTNFLQNFTTILVWKIDRGMNNYTKSKNQGLIMLVMKIGECNSQYSYK